MCECREEGAELPQRGAIVFPALVFSTAAAVVIHRQNTGDIYIKFELYIGKALSRPDLPERAPRSFGIGDLLVLEKSRAEKRSHSCEASTVFTGVRSCCCCCCCVRRRVVLGYIEGHRTNRTTINRK